MKFFVSLLATACAAAPVLVDKHKTTIKLLSLDGKDSLQSSPSHFAVSVQRVDSIYDEDISRVVAARVTSVLLSFDVDVKSGMPVLNDVPIPLGITRMSVQAKTWTGMNQDLVDVEDEVPEFDIGIVDVTVEAKGVEMRHNGILVRKVILTEKVEEINGVKVEQSEAVQQVLELMPDGTVVKGSPCTAGSAESGVHRHVESFKSYLRALPDWAKLMLSGASVMAVAAFVVMFVARIASALHTRKYSPVNEAEAALAAPATTKAVDACEKKVTEESEESLLPAYQQSDKK